MFMRVFCLLIPLFFSMQVVMADTASLGDAQKEKLIKASEAVEAAQIKGPAKVALLDQATLQLPARYAFVPKKEGNQLMQAFGNSVDDDLVGLVVSLDEHQTWIVAIDYIQDGYIKDEGAKKWNADDLMKGLKEGNAESNKERKANGYPEMEILGWIEKPNYDSTKHQLIWSMRAKVSGSDSSIDNINYNTYKLGRNGYFTFNLLTDSTDVEKDKIHAQKILNAATFDSGKRYEDFNPATDKIAAYGITALVAGAAAKKLGLFALAGVFLVKIWKLLIVIPVLLWSRIKRLFNRS